ncbi:MAG: PspC domain-containing protein [Candidatus Woesearchaeota archaeon]
MARKKKTSAKQNEIKDTKSPAVRRIYRSRNDVMLGGVCAGIAEYTYTDPTLIRLLWVVISIVTGIAPGFLAYLIVWIIMPIAPKK